MISKLRRRVHDVLEVAQSDQPFSRFVDFGLIGLITLNVLAIIIESIDAIGTAYRAHFDMFELISVAIFTLEYLSRVWVCIDDPDGKYRHRFLGRVDGFLEEILFTEGSVVEEGVILYRIDDRPYRARVDRQEAILASKQTALEKFRRDGARIKPLFEENAASQLDYDNGISAIEQAQASVREVEADLKSARLDLEYTELRAPIKGLIGEFWNEINGLQGTTSGLNSRLVLLLE